MVPLCSSVSSPVCYFAFAAVVANNCRQGQVSPLRLSTHRTLAVPMWRTSRLRRRRSCRVAHSHPQRLIRLHTRLRARRRRQRRAHGARTCTCRWHTTKARPPRSSRARHRRSISLASGVSNVALRSRRPTLKPRTRTSKRTTLHLLTRRPLRRRRPRRLSRTCRTSRRCRTSGARRMRLRRCQTSVAQRLGMVEGRG